MHQLSVYVCQHPQQIFSRVIHDGNSTFYKSIFFLFSKMFFFSFKKKTVFYGLNNNKFSSPSNIVSGKRVWNRFCCIENGICKYKCTNLYMTMTIHTKIKKGMLKLKFYPLSNVYIWTKYQLFFIMREIILN